MRHLIQKQYLDIELLGTEAEGFNVQNRLAALCANALPQMMERVLDRFAPKDGVLSINRLEIDAGDISWEHLEQDLSAQLEKAIIAAFIAKNYPTFGPDIKDKAQGQLPPDAVFKTQSQANWDAFVYFLEIGMLPWHFSIPQGQTLETLIQTQLLSADPKSDIFGHKKDVLRRKLQQRTIRQRMAVQFSEDFVGTWLHLLDAGLWKEVQVAIGFVRSLPKSEEAIRLEKKLWETALGLVAGSLEVAATPSIQFQQQAVFLKAHIPAAAQKILATCLAAIYLPEPNRLKTLRERLLEDGGQNQAAQALLLLLPTTDHRPRTLNADIENTQTAEDKPLTEGIYVQNAGVVLLHPFLPQFFTALGVVEAAKITQPDRALHLLHYLATGAETAAEYELTFAKLLCGIPLEQPVETIAGLTEAEKAEALNLLETVVRYWDALRDTSPDGLRGAFLRRLGKVSAVQDGEWLLQLETQTHDILLDQLPWGIGMIQLPWMKNMLRVEWG